MKNLLLIAAILFNIGLTKAQWKWKNPLPPENHYKSVVHLTGQIYITAGDNLILLTEDGGLTWHQTEHPQGISPNKVWFIDTQTGFVVGDDGTILKTLDGGLHWDQMESGTIHDLLDVRFVNPMQGYISGSGGRIFRTTDGGENWTLTQLPGVFQRLVSIRFYDDQTGYIAGRNGLFAKTTDGGESWNIIHEQLDFYWIYDMHLTDEQTLLLACWGGIFKSTDGGQQWTEKLAPADEEMAAFSFIDENTGYALGHLSRIYKTTDGGESWINTHLLDDYFLCNLCEKAIAFKNENKGIAAGFEKITWLDMENQTYDTPIQSVTSANLSDASFSNDTTLFAVGFAGMLVSRTNGRTWEVLPPAQSGDAYSNIQFIDEHTGYASGGNFLNTENQGIVIKTIDGGDNWELLFNPTDPLRGLHFVDTETGYLLGQDGIIYKTTDGGNEWLTRDTGTNTQLNSIFFTSAEKGFACGSNGTIVRTTDGGETWTTANQVTNFPLFSIYFVSYSVGFAATRANGIVKTTDAGESWEWLSLSGAPMNYFMRNIIFTTPEKGYLVGGAGFLFVTTDGGESWEFKQLPGTATFFALASGHENTLIAVGYRGNIIRKYTGPEEHPLDDEDEDDENPTFIAIPHENISGTITVFPNPFSSDFTVKGAFNSDYVSVEIFDMQGRKLYQEPKTSTQHKSIKVSPLNLREGMYMLRISDGIKVNHAKILKKP